MQKEKKKERFYQYGLIAIVFLGILIRCFAYFRNLPFWSDEAALALNIMNKTYLELFKGLDYLQVAPPMFLVMSKFLLETVNPVYDCMRDILLRQISVISGIASIPLFYYLIKLITKNKKEILTGLFLFTFNTTTILYCAQFKQYSFELLISIILMIIFYKIIFEDKDKWYYSLFIALAPWFSLSSLLIIGSYFLMLVWQKPKQTIKLYLPFFVSFLLFYIFSLKPVSAYNYEGMYNCWRDGVGYGFVSLAHPTRIAIRFGGLFSFDKITAECIGFFMLLVAFCSIFPLNKNKLNKKLYLWLPIFMTFLASAIKLYPIEARLILFLYPLFIIAISEYNLRFRSAILTIACAISLITSVYYTINPYKFYTSSAEAAFYAQRNLKPDEFIILGNTLQKYAYYYYIKSKNQVVHLKNGCNEVFLEACNQEIEALPDGIYYLILKNDPEKQLTSKVKVLDKYKRYSTVIKFKK